MNSLQRAERAKLDSFQNASNAAIYTELEGLQEQQQEEEEQGPLTGTLAVPKYHPGPCSLIQAKNTS